MLCKPKTCTSLLFETHGHLCTAVTDGTFHTQSTRGPRTCASATHAGRAHHRRVTYLVLSALTSPPCAYPIALAPE